MGGGGGGEWRTGAVVNVSEFGSEDWPEDWWSKPTCRLVKGIGNFSNNNCDGNENVKKAIGLITIITTLHMQYTFFVHFFAGTTR